MIFYKGVVKHRKLILVLFVMAAVAGAFFQTLVGVNYDISDYLPADSHSTVSMEVMEQEFDGNIPNARVMIRDVTISQALEYKELLKEIDGVEEVTWLDDTADIAVPLETLDADLVETYYKDENALFNVAIDEEKNLEAVDAIRSLIGEENAMAGNAVSTAVATVNSESEIMKIAAFAVAFVTLVLFVTTESWLEPLVVLGGLGIAILINGGTNLIFGEISFVTNAAGSILQLAVSLDYSVFLIHRFEEYREEKPNVEDAMVEALCKSTSSILSSGLTTVIGFLALVLMRFEIGPDLGLALAKGVALSLITVFIFMPAFILVTYKLIDKTRHRPFIPELKGFGRFVYRVMFPMLCVLLVIVVPSYLASNANEYYYGTGHMFGEETQLGTDTAAIEEIFGKSDTYVLLVPSGDTPAEKKLSEDLHALSQVTSVISYVDMAGAEIPREYLDEDTLALLESGHYSRMVLTVNVDYEGKETFDLVEKIREIADSYYPEAYYLAGQGVSTYDLMQTVTADMVKVNAIAIIAVLVVLLLMMKKISLPVILVLSIESAIWINLALPYFTGSTVFYIAYLIISSIQLGATVDYAILFSERYQEMREVCGKKDAIVETVSVVTVSILTSGSVLAVVGFLMGKVSTNGLLAQLGTFLGVGALCSLAVVLFVLPGLLYLFDGLFMRKKPVYEEKL